MYNGHLIGGKSGHAEMSLFGHMEDFGKCCPMLLKVFWYITSLLGMKKIMRVCKKANRERKERRIKG